MEGVGGRGWGRIWVTRSVGWGRRETGTDVCSTVGEVAGGFKGIRKEVSAEDCVMECILNA